MQKFNKWVRQRMDQHEGANHCCLSLFQCDGFTAICWCAGASSQRHEDVLSINIKPRCKLSFRQFSSILLHEIGIFSVSRSFCEKNIVFELLGESG